MRRLLIAVATVVTLAAGAAIAVLTLGLAGSDSNDFVESDKPRPPMIILTRLGEEGGESGE